ncbi:protein of unknown function [Methylorubrum extorquens]|uniref:Uncharacterized protein n=1 Tax=Methylorubrum extorquens TaxID=408 RepID=A0A2N9AMC3_METEX|nr:protein of unknown function [Methylorubrum extorquens]
MMRMTTQCGGNFACLPADWAGVTFRHEKTRRLSPTGFCRGHALSRDGSCRLALGLAGELDLSQRLGSHYPCRSWLGGVS